MPKHRLKSALTSHLAFTAHKAAESRASTYASAKAASTKHSVAERRALKRAKATANAAAAGASESVETGTTIVDKGKARATIPIEHDDTVLLLGEANFSFAVSLVTAHGHAPHLVCATSYDTEAECYAKYPDASGHVTKLRELGARVGFGVDAGALEKSGKVVGKGKRWSRVVFNFPHAGAGITDQDRNVLTNQHLLLRTLHSVAPLLTEGPSKFPIIVTKGGKGKSKGKMMKGKANRPKRPTAPESDDEDDIPLDDVLYDDDEDSTGLTRSVPTASSFTPPNKEGTILITLLAQSPYTLWDLARLATKPPSVCPGTHSAQPRYRLLRSFEFVPAAWPGYAHRRTIGWREGLSKAGNEEIVGRQGKARTWEFARADDDE